MSNSEYGILFDLDQTLIDSRCIKSLRDSRDWKKVFDNLHTVKEYEGISDLLSGLHEENIKIGIISSSPTHYCEKIVLQNKWAIDAVVGYHDTTNHKPNPEPIFLGLKKIEISKEHVLSIGDLPKDIIASKTAGVKSVGAAWGCDNIADLVAVSPDIICYSVEELNTYIHMTFLKR
jgi:HAD superfamily hydrolase (TIGR01549 family)